MKYYFSEYMTEACHKHGLIKQLNGTVATLQFHCPTGNHITVSFDEIDADKRAYVRGNLLFAPISREGREQFLNTVLQFNANAIQSMSMGLMPHPQDERAMCPTWYVPKVQQTAQDWDWQMQIFEKMAEHAYEEVRKVLMQWVSSLH